MQKYFIKTFGCQYNEWDAARLDFLLQKLNLVPSCEKDADIIFILSCSVRKSAVDRAMGVANNNLEKKTIVTGCVLNNDKKKYEKKDILIWDINKPEELKEILGIHGPKKFSELMEDGNPNSAYLPIMKGCNNFCSYCAVPYTRGRETSRPFQVVVSDFKKLVKAGHKEITLLGQNVNSYKNTSPCSPPNLGGGGGGKNDFTKLLKALNDIPGDFTISFTSNHPKDMTDEIIAAVRDLPKVKKEVHLPLQSGSNKILRVMNRPYTKEKYLELVEKIKKQIPEIRITTDAIVGFPGETEEDFQQTVEVYEKVKFAQSFTNKYSPRFGTAAYKLGDPISWAEKERRWRLLNEIANKPKKS